MSTNEGPGSVPHRFNRIIVELEKRFPHPNPFDSAKAPEDYMLEAVDALIERNQHLETLLREAAGEVRAISNEVRTLLRNHGFKSS